jgi:predicted nicotinamide N-methyase
MVLDQPTTVLGLAVYQAEGWRQAPPERRGTISVAKIWSSTDPPYMCLKDRVRTEGFRRAIREVVRPGDVVVDAGAGTGILSFFAAEAGAKRVYAVEIDPVLVARLRTSIGLNGLQEIVTVIPGDVTEVALPRAVDVLIGELVDTGLMDEMQVAVVNGLRARGVVGPATRVIPERYTTFADLVAVDDTYYGFRIAAPKHEWPFYAGPDRTWLPTSVSGMTDRVPIAHADFRRPIDPTVSSLVRLVGKCDGLANGIRLSGALRLSPTVTLGATNALNGDKILHVEDGLSVTAGAPIALRIEYVLGGGLGSFRYRPAAVPDDAIRPSLILSA